MSCDSSASPKYSAGVERAAAYSGMGWRQSRHHGRDPSSDDNTPIQRDKNKSYQREEREI